MLREDTVRSFLETALRIPETHLGKHDDVVDAFVGASYSAVDGKIRMITDKEEFEREFPHKFVGGIDPAVPGGDITITKMISLEEFKILHPEFVNPFEIDFARIEREYLAAMMKDRDRKFIEGMPPGIYTVRNLIGNIIPVLKWDFIPIDVSYRDLLTVDDLDDSVMPIEVEISALDENMILTRIFADRNKLVLYQDWEWVDLAPFLSTVGNDGIFLITIALQEFYIKLVTTTRYTLEFQEGDFYDFQNQRKFFYPGFNKFMTTTERNDLLERELLKEESARKKAERMSGKHVEFSHAGKKKKS